VRHRARSKGGARGRHDRGRGGGRRPRLHRIKVSAAGGRAGRGSATAPFHGGARWRPRLQPPRLHAPRPRIEVPDCSPRDCTPPPSNQALALPSASPPSFLPLLHLSSRRTRRGRGASASPDQPVHGGSGGGASGAGEGRRIGCLLAYEGEGVN
jgi:hypothetical protein